MTETLPRLLLRQSEAEHPVLWGRTAAPHFGREFDRMLAQRVLIEEAPAETWGLCSDCECGLDARPIQHINGRLVAVCPFDHQADAHLTDTDIRSFRIEVDALVGEIARASAFPNVPAEVMPGLWHLGSTASGRAVFVALTLTGARQPGLFSVIRATTRSAPITMLTPSLPASETLRFEEAGIHRVTTREVIGSRGNTASPFAIDAMRFVPAQIAEL